MPAQLARPSVEGAVEHAGEVSLVPVASVDADQLAVGALSLGPEGHPVRDGVYHAGRRASAITQDGGPAHDLDELSGEGIDGHRVVRTEARDVLRREPALEHVGAEGILPADDRSAGPPAEARARDRGYVPQRVANGRAQLFDDVVTPQSIDRHRELIRRVGERRSGHHDVLDFLVVLAVFVLVGMLVGVGVPVLLRGSVLRGRRRSWEVGRFTCLVGGAGSRGNEKAEA